MRVLQLGPYPPPHGGVQTNVAAIRNYLRKRQIPSAVICTVRASPSAEEEVYYPRSAIQLLRLLSRLQFDIIHLHFGGHLTSRFLGLAAVCSLLPRARSVLTFHSGGYPTSKQGQRIRRWSLPACVLRHFDRIIAVNKQILEFLLRIGVFPERIRLISPDSFPGMDPEKQVPMPEQLAAFLASHRPVILSVGLLEPEYDLGLQIQSMSAVRARLPGAGLVIIGSGSLEAALRARITSQNCAADILLTGDVPHRITLEAIRASAVMIRTTYYDGDSLSLREALRLGTPVIATDNGMRPPGVHLIPPSNSRALCQALEEVLQQQRGPAAQRLEPDEHNLEEVLCLYRELIPQD